MDWKKTSRVANYWRFDSRTNKTVCLLCPRHCRRSNGEFGFCGVRGNVNNEVHTYIYGRTLSPTIENIETEAVNHYSPGAKILSLGNIGCMMQIGSGTGIPADRPSEDVAPGYRSGRIPRVAAQQVGDELGSVHGASACHAG